MLALDLVTDEIPPLKITDTGIKAMKWMDEFKVMHLPVIERGYYLGLISDADILDLNSPNEAIKNFTNILNKTHSFESQHIYDVIKIIADNKVTLVPVVGEDQRYSGAISLHHLIEEFSKVAAINDPGSIIVLELNINDYSLQEIAQIIEGNGARILSVYLTSHTDSTKLEVTIKINQSDIGGILQTFNRYDYSVKASFQENVFHDSLKDRYEELMKYLNI